MRQLPAILFLGFFFFLDSGLQAQYTLPKPPETGIEWNKELHDFGEIPHNKPVSCSFILTNTGDEPLILTYVKGACGCTTTHYSKEPVLPGKSTTIKATFDAKRPGVFHKSVRVETNRDVPRISLEFKGTVLPPK